MKLRYISTFPEIRERPELEAVPGGHFVGSLPKIISGKQVKEHLREAMQEMTDYLNSVRDGDGPFQLKEAEMTFQIDQSGKVNLVLADVGGRISGGIRLKWKRR